MFKWPVIIYVLVCIIAIVIPASEGYQFIGWKLFVGQAYAIPAFIVSLIIFRIFKGNKAVQD
ncbi:DUF4017 domain-containing protein [Anaerobacillus alkaliphilus]|uniref:DUF4017 domain-containing protein n=1 Tax=Anaerobacillus alkaliphilus TaxID=1548597 RepID=A0A4Q0W1T3_9BACI|nr:DUF4017 family protein [Anaerobacillus alkaliphilus]RXJ04531.1 DUF4017 domain-containing protein [Anaerobacillus alkaliphilus]